MKFMLLALLFVLTSCGTVGPQGGMIFHDIRYAQMATDEAKPATKRGQACVRSYLGMYSKGDATVTSAKKRAGINTVSTVEASSYSILGIYNKYCTIVTGL